MSETSLEPPRGISSSRMVDTWHARPAEQQPRWHDHAHYGRVLRELRQQQALVTPAELDAFSAAMTAVAAGHAQLLQLGDCAERLEECTANHAAAKLRLVRVVAEELATATGKPVVQVGRLGGQLAKPRSKPTEWHGEIELPAFRGHLINSEQPTSEGRVHDPRRMLWGYRASADVHEELRRQRRSAAGDGTDRPRGPWSSHEALVLDYEQPLVRAETTTGLRFLASTHFPWIGDRTRQPGSGHAALLAAVRNPVGCKIGPKAEVADILELCDTIDPNRTPGRLTLIARMGRDHVGRILPDIVAAVRAAGHQVVWLCDPMHGNTVIRDGIKTRRVADLTAEVAEFRAVVEAAGERPCGLHLEATGTPVTECLGAGVETANLRDRYTSLCDPRLNYEQTREVLRAWSA